jgi:hypothetical protein
LVVVAVEHNQTVLLVGRVAEAVAGHLQHIQVVLELVVKVTLAAMAEVVMLVVVAEVAQAVWVD